MYLKNQQEAQQGPEGTEAAASSRIGQPTIQDNLEVGRQLNNGDRAGHIVGHIVADAPQDGPARRRGKDEHRE